MPITKSLRDNIRYFGITLPIDRRTKDYKEELNKRQLNEKTYLELLRKQVKQAKAKEQKKVKKIQKETKVQFERLETQKKISKVRQNYILENKIRPVQINAIRNKLFYMKPSQTAWKSYQSYVIQNTRPELIDDYYNVDKENEIISYNDLLNSLKFYKIDEYLMKFLNHKVWFSFELEELERDRNRNSGAITEKTEVKTIYYSSKSKLIMNKTDINQIINDYLDGYRSKFNTTGYNSIISIVKMD